MLKMLMCKLNLRHVWHIESAEDGSGRYRHCTRCGKWLDDDDQHEDCPVPEEPEADRAADDAQSTQASQQPFQSDAVQNPALQLSFPKSESGGVLPPKDEP